MSETLAPVGVRLRPYAGAPDLPAIARIRNAEAERDGIPDRHSAAELAAEYAHASDGFDPVRDVTIAEVDGVPVGVAWREWFDTTDGLREYRVDGAVDPAWRRRGIGGVLLAENERRALEAAATHAIDRPRCFGSWSGATQDGDRALLERAGFRTARWFFTMTRPNLDDIPPIELPDGIEVRPVTTELALPVWRADVEAFQDHWGGFDTSDDGLARWLDSPSTDLSLWAVAFDGDDVAGAVLNVIDAAENEALGVRVGWLASVFTRRPWRRRGLASALIARSLAMLRDRGMEQASLGVDADNPSGALGLYEGLGFAVSHRSLAWRRPF